MEEVVKINDTGCTGCGSCCKAIWLGHKMSDIKSYASGDPSSNSTFDAKFILENWEEITVEEATELNPQFQEKYPQAKDRGFFYKCNAFDAETKRCTKYLDRPNLCRDFPFYPGSHNHKLIDGKLMLAPGYTLYSKDCGFQGRIASKELWDREYRDAENSFSKEINLKPIKDDQP